MTIAKKTQPKIFNPSWQRDLEESDNIHQKQALQSIQNYLSACNHYRYSVVEQLVFHLYKSEEKEVWSTLFDHKGTCLNLLKGLAAGSLDKVTKQDAAELLGNLIDFFLSLADEEKLKAEIEYVITVNHCVGDEKDCNYIKNKFDALTQAEYEKY